MIPGLALESGEFIPAHELNARVQKPQEMNMGGFDAADMATAAAQGFRDGVASLSLPAAGQEPVAEVMFDEGRKYIQYTMPLELIPVGTRFYAAPQPAVAAGWMPIETAPKNGRTLLLGWFNSHKKWRTTRGEWLSQDHIDEYAEDPDCMDPGWHETTVEDDDGKCWPIEPTHWMPLPPAPSTEGEKA